MDGSTTAFFSAGAENSGIDTLNPAAVLESLPCEALVVDANSGDVLFTNAQARTNLGYTAAEAEQLSLRAISNDLFEALSACKIAPDAGQAAAMPEMDADYHRKDGSVYSSEVRLHIESSGNKTLLVCFACEKVRPGEHTEQLRRYAQFNQSLLDSSEAGILSLTPVRNEQGDVVDYRFVAANEANALLTGRTPEQLLGKTLLEEFPGNEAEGLYDIYHQVATTGRAAEFEVHYNQDDVKDWFRIKAVQTGEDGVTINFSQITPAKRYELALKELHLLSLDTDLDLDMFAQGILEIGRKIFDCPFGIYARNDGETYELVETIGNLPVSSGDTLPLSETVCAAVVREKAPVALHDLKSVHEKFSRAGFGCYIGAPLMTETRVNGTLCFLGPEAKNSPFSDSDLDNASMMADILSARIKLIESKNALRNNRDELQILFNNMPARIWYKDDRNTILHANTSAAKSMGFEDPEDLENADTYKLFPEMAAKYHEDDLAVINSNMPLRNIVESYTPLHGDQGWVSTDKIPLEVPSGEKRLLVVASDITTLKQREEQLEKLNKNLQEFAFVAAHDLQAPLRQTAMFSQLLHDEIADSAVSEDALETLKNLETSVQNMRSMVKNLYHLFSLDTQQIKLLPVDIASVVKRASASLEEVLDDSQAEILFDALPTVLGAEDLLAQLFQNLFANAVKYAGADRPVIKISSLQNPVKLVHEIRIQDNGVGIPQEFHEKVFEPFKRLHHKEEVEGSGIGLALCRRIANLHKGALRIDPKYQDGCCFVLEVPYY